MIRDGMRILPTGEEAIIDGQYQNKVVKRWKREVLEEMLHKITSLEGVALKKDTINVIPSLYKTVLDLMEQKEIYNVVIYFGERNHYFEITDPFMIQKVTTMVMTDLNSYSIKIVPYVR